MASPRTRKARKVPHPSSTYANEYVSLPRLPHRKNRHSDCDTNNQQIDHRNPEVIAPKLPNTSMQTSLPVWFTIHFKASMVVLM